MFPELSALMQRWSTCFSVKISVCTFQRSACVFSFTSPSSEHDKPDDYLAMSSPDIVGLCFPEFSNPGKSSTAAVCALSKRNMKGGCEFEVSPRSTDRLSCPHIYFHLFFMSVKAAASGGSLLDDFEPVDTEDG